MGRFDQQRTMPDKDQARAGRSERMPVPEKHHVRGSRLEPPVADGLELALFGLGCFWGAEKTFWQAEGVVATSVG